MLEAMRALWEVLLVMFVTVFSKTIGTKPSSGIGGGGGAQPTESGYCLSWRLAAETNNLRPWRTVPEQCLHYVEHYMLGGQYQSDMFTVMEEIAAFLKEIIPAADGLDAWVLDVDDTCISNLPYYAGKRYGGDPYDPIGFKNWAIRESCPAIPAILSLYKELIEVGFKVFLITGRDEEFLGAATKENLQSRGFVGYERLILRAPTYRGQIARIYKPQIRKKLAEEGYRIRGNIGDQWSDLLGEYAGDRTFKLPNPLYFVP